MLYEWNKFGRKFTTHLQLSYTDSKSENLTDNKHISHLFIVIYPHKR